LFENTWAHSDNAGTAIRTNQTHGKVLLCLHCAGIVPDMIYNVFGGTLNLAISIYLPPYDSSNYRNRTWFIFILLLAPIYSVGFWSEPCTHNVGSWRCPVASSLRIGFWSWLR